MNATFFETCTSNLPQGAIRIFYNLLSFKRKKSSPVMCLHYLRIYIKAPFCPPNLPPHPQVRCSVILIKGSTCRSPVCCFYCFNILYMACQSLLSSHIPKNFCTTSLLFLVSTLVRHTFWEIFLYLFSPSVTTHRSLSLLQSDKPASSSALRLPGPSLTFTPSIDDT